MTDIMSLDGASLTLWSDPHTARIGRFTCPDVASGAAVLGQALLRLQQAGCRQVLAPMDGDTWHSYRLVVESNGQPPFLLEPPDRPMERAALVQAGFRPVAHYASAIAPLTGVRRGLGGGRDIRLRPFNAADPLADLALLHRLSLAGFARNLYYQPIPWPDFLALYQPMLPLVQPDLILFAEDADGSPLGFAFGLPDSGMPQTAIFKTYAALRPGLGGILSNGWHRAAAASGYEHIIHALMQDDNLSLRHSVRSGGQIFRRYALFGRDLT